MRIPFSSIFFSSHSVFTVLTGDGSAVTVEISNEKDDKDLSKTS